MFGKRNSGKDRYGNEPDREVLCFQSTVETDVTRILFASEFLRPRDVVRRAGIGGDRVINCATRRIAAIPSVNGDVLSEILAVEREIGARLDAEREAARQWLEHTRGEIEQAKLSELTALQASAAREQEAAKRAAHDKAAAILQEAGTEAERIRRLEDTRLIPVVRRNVLLIAQGRAK